MVNLLFYPFRLVDIQKQAFWFPEKPRVVRNCISFGRRVNDWKHLLEVVRNELHVLLSVHVIQTGCRATYAVVQDFILLFHARHKGVLGQIIGPRAVLRIGALDLLIEGLYMRRKKSLETKCLALLLGKGTSSVEIWSLEKCRALA